MRPEDLDNFFNVHRANFSPQAIYRAKTRGRSGAGQLEFVDLGLMPLVEQQIGRKLTGLVERVVHHLRQDMRWKGPNLEQGRWLSQAVFWLLAAKILHDKEVPNFTRLDLSEPQAVFARVGKHYGQPESQPVLPRERCKALAAAADAIRGYAPLTHVTTEALTEVYESALVSRETRQKLGTHSTPSFLVDYIVRRLEPWIREIPEAGRYVFEPACGHAAFLVAAMRLLRELLPADTTEAERTKYLRSHMAGIEVDAFAVEIARLSLTLADVPNPNGWQLESDDMFVGEALERQAGRAMIVLANPPFEDFTLTERGKLQRSGSPPLLVNKTSEMLRRVLPHLRRGAVVGVVVPQGLLHSAGASELRMDFLTNFELQEIAVFPDRVFRFSDMETAVILARRRKGPASAQCPVCYRRIREQGLPAFRQLFRADEESEVPQTRFLGNDSDLRLPPLDHIWQYLGRLPQLSSLARIGQGFSLRSAPKATSGSAQSCPRAVKAYGRLGRNLMLHGEPKQTSFDLRSENLMSERSGTQTGVPQVLMNHARVSRGPWRIKGFLDRDGHAFNTNYNGLRPLSPEDTPLEYLWALINSPLANAFCYAHSSKRHILTGTVERMPVPRATTEDVRRVVGLACDYLDFVHPRGDVLEAEVDQSRALHLLLQVDAEVLRLYDLPPRLERQLLDLFDGWRRPGVPFVQERHFPADCDAFVPLHEYLSEAFQACTVANLAARMKERPASPEVLAALSAAAEMEEE